MRLFSLLALCLFAVTATEQRKPGSVDLLLADAESASVINFWSGYQIEDHYGDPSRFQKFIIRRPPVFA